MSGDDVVTPLVRSVRSFCREQVRPLEIDRAHRIPLEVLEGLASLGLFGVTLPEAFGGANLGAEAATRVVAALAEVDRSVAVTVGLHLGLGTRGLVAFGTPAQQERWLPQLASGESIAAFATTEPEAGSDLAALAARATAQADGSLRLSGNKLYVTNGGLASLLTVTAGTPGLGGAARGTSLLLVDPGLNGVERQPEEHKLGLRGSSTTGFCFEDVALPADALLGGEPGRGAVQLPAVLAWGRLLMSAGCVGTAEAALKAAIVHTHHRRQFRRALVKLEVVQQQLARGGARLFGMRALVTVAARAEADEPRLQRLTTSAKVFCSEGAWALCDLAVQLHGGSGYIEDTGVALMLRDARVTRIFEGANDVLLTHAGLGEVLEPAAAPADEALAPLADAITARRAGLGGLKGLQRHAAQRALGLAVMWRDAASAATQLASTPLERAAAALLRDEALAAAREPTPPVEPMNVLVESILEGVLP